ncbi:MAG: flagella basal body P-ring formation protein FlgA [Myxococcales bacterium]|nr:flagella basal body P-ring formation protein FlgA [Myxococcales bacterium]
MPSPRLPIAALLLSLMLLLGSTPAAFADSGITLAEIIPALAGSEVGAVVVAPEPPVGASRTVRRRQILRALRAAGHSAQGLKIPRATRIERGVQSLAGEELEALLRAAVADAVDPCELEALRGPSQVRLGDGEVEAEVDAREPLRAGSMGLVVELSAGGHSQRLPLRVTLSCPPPLVEAGARVRAVAVVGNVRASTTAEARQSGRRGEVIKLRLPSRRSLMRGRVLDANTVELLP